MPGENVLKGGQIQMWMTEFDICQRYRQAKNPKSMIGTLADLNAVPKEDITEILIRREKSDWEERKP